MPELDAREKERLVLSPRLLLLEDVDIAGHLVIVRAELAVHPRRFLVTYPGKLLLRDLIIVEIADEIDALQFLLVRGSLAVPEEQLSVAIIFLRVFRPPPNENRALRQRVDLRVLPHIVEDIEATRSTFPHIQTVLEDVGEGFLEGP